MSDILASQKGIKMVDQPFDWGMATNRQKSLLPPAEDYQFIHFEGKDRQRLDRYACLILEGRLPIYRQKNPLNKKHTFFSDRLVVKIINAKSLISYFHERFNVHIIWFLRHPIPTSLSVIRNNWELHLEAYLNNEHFVDHFMTSSLMEFSKDIMKSGSTLQKYVLNWCIENLVPFRYEKYPEGWLVLTYEELLVNPGVLLRFLYEELELTDLGKMYRAFYEPSGSSGHVASGKMDILTWDTAPTSIRTGYLIKNWRNQLDDIEVEMAFEVVERFGISAYTPDSFMPNSDFMLFPELSMKLYDEINGDK